MAGKSFACMLSVLMIAVAACAGGERSATTTTSSAQNGGSQRGTVTLVTHQTPGDTFWDLVRRGAEAAAPKDGLNL
jgi:simple sugar transport system substrate-binding protein